MTSDAILDSDKRQSISDDDVAYFAKKGVTVKAGIKCDFPGHGRMLMSAKSGLLECGRGGCDFQAVAPTD
jgi:hypothetical protein